MLQHETLRARNSYLLEACRSVFQKQAPAQWCVLALVQLCIKVPWHWVNLLLNGSNQVVHSFTSSSTFSPNFFPSLALGCRVRPQRVTSPAAFPSGPSFLFTLSILWRALSEGFVSTRSKPVWMLVFFFFILLLSDAQECLLLLLSFFLKE